MGADLPGQNQLPCGHHNAQARLCAAQEIIAACADPGILTELITRTETVLTQRIGTASPPDRRLAAGVAVGTP